MSEVDLQTLMVAASRGNGEVVKAILDKGRFTPEQLSDALVVARQESWSRSTTGMAWT